MGQRNLEMKRSMIAVLGVVVMLMAGSMVSAADVAGWDAFVIRNSNSGNIAPLISNDAGGGKLFSIALAGQKAGWGTDDMNGKKIGDILSLSITRDSSVVGWGPYMNLWVTDGLGGYACVSNEPSNAGEWAGSSPYNTTWDVLKNATTWVYEVNPTSGPSSGFKLPNGTTTYTNIPAGTVTPHFTFGDFANYTIATPPAHWGGTGAPDVLGASPYTAYGVNWVFGDTQSNYLGGYLVGNPSVTGVPEPGTLVLLGAGGLGVLAYAWRRRRVRS
jgi:hypothetical protein